MYDIKMKDFIEKHNLLYSSQYGFLQGHSTQHGMWSFHWFEKAFDTVNQNNI